jgi:predicted transcriptional regulator
MQTVSAGGDPMSDRKKLTVNLSAEIVDVLKEMAERNRSSMTEELRNAISDRKFFIDQKDAGKRIILEGSDEGADRTIVEFR